MSKQTVLFENFRRLLFRCFDGLVLQLLSRPPVLFRHRQGFKLIACCDLFSSFRLCLVVRIRLFLLELLFRFSLLGPPPLVIFVFVLIGFEHRYGKGAVVAVLYRSLVLARRLDNALSV